MTKEKLKNSDIKASTPKSIKNRSPKNEPDDHAAVPAPTITKTELSNELNFNEKYFSEELTGNGGTQSSVGLTEAPLTEAPLTEAPYSEEKRLKMTLETVGLHLVETRIDDRSSTEQKEQKLGRKIKRNGADRQGDDSEPLTMVETKK